MAKRVKQEFLVEKHPFHGLVLYEVTGEELDQLEKETLSVGEDFSFFLASITTAISLTASLATFDVPAGKLYDSFFTLTSLAYLGGVFFGIRWAKSRRSFKSVVGKIKDRIGPLGEEGKELEPDELANLPSQEAQSKKAEHS